MNGSNIAVALTFLLAAPLPLLAASKTPAPSKKAVRLDPPAQRLSQLEKAVGLSEEQMTDIKSILEATDRDVRKAMEAGNQRIREALDDDQGASFDGFLKEEERRASQTAGRPRAPEARKRLVPMSEWESEENGRKQGGQGGMMEEGGQEGGQGGRGGQGGMRGQGQGGMQGGQGGMRGGPGGGPGGGMGGQGGMHGQGGQGGMGPKNKKCGDGVCDEVEQTRGVCPSDCQEQ